MIYKHTAVVAKTKSAETYAIGRSDVLDGKPPEWGGYYVWVRKANYMSHVKGGIGYTWRYVKKDLTYNEAVILMNKRIKFKAFETNEAYG